MIRLGSFVRDRLSGVEGVATGVAEYLYGCRRVLIEPMQQKDGKPVEGFWADEQRVSIIKDRTEFTTAGVLDDGVGPGGPLADPVRRPDPTR